jgi:hypothetical protein
VRPILGGAVFAAGVLIGLGLVRSGWLRPARTPLAHSAVASATVPALAAPPPPVVVLFPAAGPNAVAPPPAGETEFVELRIPSRHKAGRRGRAHRRAARRREVPADLTLNPF